MATDVARRRYQTWYAVLLRLYPRLFRERFGEGMAQVFRDHCREHRDTRRGLFAFALRIFSETLVGIVREHINHINQLAKTTLRVALVARSVDGAVSGIPGGERLELERRSFRAGVSPILRDRDAVHSDREEDGH